MESRPESKSSEDPAVWSAATRVVFRFCFLYFPLFFLTMIPNPALARLICWVGVQFFRASSLMYPGGSDTIFDYLRTLLCVVLATLGTLVWSALARRGGYAGLHRWFRTAVRLLLVFAMNMYGWDKIFLLQMPEPGPDTLVSQFGRLTPFQLLWSFMGYSRTYQIFSGITEVLAGALLLIPRFTLAGGVLCFGVMTHVFVINMSYDVPVKILSFHLLLLAVFLIAPDADRLADLFVRNRPAAPSRSFAPSSRPWARRLTAGLFTVVVLLALYLNFQIRGIRTHNLQAARELPFYGAWSVEEFAEDGGAPHFEGSGRWLQLVLVHRDEAQIRLFDGTYDHVSLTFDGNARKFALSDDGNAQISTLPRGWKSEFAFEMPDAQTLVVSGVVEGTRVRATCRRIDVSKLPLATARFRWTSGE